MNNAREGVKRDVQVVLRVRIKRGNGMNVHVDKSRGIITLETLANINPIEPLRLGKQSGRMKRD